MLQKVIQFLFNSISVRLIASVMAVCFVGSVQSADLSYNTAATTNLTGDVSYDNVLIGVTGGNASTIVDATGTTSFTSAGSTVYVGVNLVNTPSIGTLKLGTNNNITAATKIVMGGNEPDGDSSSGHSATVTSANNGVTTILTPSFALGTSKGTGNFTLGTGATLNMGSSGSRTALVISRSDTGNGYNRPAIGNMNLAAGLANLHLNSLVIARKTVGGNSENNYTGTGALTFSANSGNHLDVSGTGNVVRIGYSEIAYMGPQGTLTIGNLESSSSITSTDNNTAILLGYHSGTVGSTVTTGTLNINGGTLTITTAGAAITSGGSGGISRLNLKDCTLIAGASSTNWMSSLTTATLTNSVVFDSGTNSIVIAQGFSGTGSLIKKGTGALTLSGTNTYTGVTAVSNGTLLVNGSVTSAVTVASGCAFGGSGTVYGNVSLSTSSTAVFSNNAPMTIFGSLILTNNVVHLNLPDKLPLGTYTLLTFNASGSSGAFIRGVVIDSGSVIGVPMIAMGSTNVNLVVSPPGMMIVIR